MTVNESDWSTLAENIQYTMNESQVMFRIDTSMVLRKSKSGKTDIIATCGRPKQLTLKDGSVVYVNLTIYKYPEST